jgi:hypothetical protein
LADSGGTLLLCAENRVGIEIRKRYNSSQSCIQTNYAF